MNDEIFKIEKDLVRSKELFEISKERLDIIKILPRDKSYKIVEEYYEIILGLLTCIMYVDGYKTLSHKSLIEYFSTKYDDLNETQVKLIDSLRKARNGIVYYGKKVNETFLQNYESEIKLIIFELSKLIDKKLR